MKLAPCAVYVTGALNDAGFEAYAVGGCCRDMLLGREPQDWGRVHFGPAGRGHARVPGLDTDRHKARHRHGPRPRRPH